MGTSSICREPAPRDADHCGMLAPPPPPTYTVSPALPPLGAAHRRTIEAGLDALTGVAASVLVTGVGRAMGRHVVELATSSGRVLLLERVPST
ncbi:MAG: hypothetical protein ACLGG9_08300 [Thermoleophilia bacterium]